MRIPIESDALMRTAARYQAQAHAVIATSVRHLSTGQRVSSAIDDASGLAIAQRMQAQYEGLLQAGRNAQDGLNFLGIADSALGRTTDMLQRIRVIAVQAASELYTDTQRAALQAAVDHTLDEIDAVAGTTTYNGRTLLDGSHPHWSLQVGAHAGQTMTIEVRAADRVALGLTGDDGAASVLDALEATDGADAAPNTQDAPADSPGEVEAFDAYESLALARAAFVQAARPGPISVRTRDAATASLDVLDRALTYVLAERAEFGAASLRLELMIQSMGVSADAARATAARITDADLPAEAATMVRAQIAAEASAHMMAQAQHTQALVVELLRPLKNLPAATPPSGPVASAGGTPVGASWGSGSTGIAPAASAARPVSAPDAAYAAPAAAAARGSAAASPVATVAAAAMAVGAAISSVAAARPAASSRPVGAPADTGARAPIVGAAAAGRGAARR